jgi:hypothetical protein
MQRGSEGKDLFLIEFFIIKYRRNYGNRKITIWQTGN